jgi:hypothetical protein
MKKIPLSRLAVLIFVAFFAALAAANYLIPAALFLRSNSFQPFVLAAVTLATLSVTLAYGFAPGWRPSCASMPCSRQSVFLTLALLGASTSRLCWFPSRRSAFPFGAKTAGRSLR